MTYSTLVPTFFLLKLYCDEKKKSDSKGIEIHLKQLTCVILDLFSNYPPKSSIVLNMRFNVPR